MTEQCAIYLDPWDKTDLEATAMLIARMPDITDRIYRGVTCQRWFVRFVPDQAVVFRWLDYGDAEPYVFPYLTPHVFTLGTPLIEITDASPARSFLSAHSIELAWEAANHVAAFLMPSDGFYRGFSIIYTTASATGGASLTILRIRRQDVGLDGHSLAKSTTVGGPWALDIIRTPPRPFWKGDAITAALSGPQPAGETVELSNVIVSVFCAWD